MKMTRAVSLWDLLSLPTASQTKQAAGLIVIFVSLENVKSCSEKRKSVSAQSLTPKPLLALMSRQKTCDLSSTEIFSLRLPLLFINVKKDKMRCYSVSGGGGGWWVVGRWRAHGK